MPPTRTKTANSPSKRSTPTTPAKQAPPVNPSAFEVSSDKWGRSSLTQRHDLVPSKENVSTDGHRTFLPTGLTLSMKRYDVTIPEIGLVAATRAMLGAGV